MTRLLIHFVVIARFHFNAEGAYIKPWILVDMKGGIFQIRPQKDFVASKGHDRLLSLRLLSELPLTVSDKAAFSDAEPNASEITRDAYDFMRRRREFTGDPLIRRWNALIRLSNFASVESSPLCVSIFRFSCRRLNLDYLGYFAAGINRSVARPPSA